MRSRRDLTPMVFGTISGGLNKPHFDALITEIKALNEEIAEDLSLGRGFCIGHSYFCGCKNARRLHG